MLSTITGVHSHVHLRENNYWSTLKEPPSSHDEFMQRCNVHLAYLGNDTFIELVLRTTTVKYNVFGIEQPLELIESSPVIIGTLSSAETSTLDMLLKLEEIPSDKTGNKETPLIDEGVRMQMSIDDSKHDERLESEREREHDDSESTICYEYKDYQQETLNDESDKVYEEHNDMKQTEIELRKNVTPPHTTKPESRKQTLRKRPIETKEIST